MITNHTILNFHLSNNPYRKQLLNAISQLSHTTHPKRKEVLGERRKGRLTYMDYPRLERDGGEI